MHQSFTDTLVKWLIDNFPMFADSFSVLSVQCVARGLAASFLYKTSVPHRAVVPCDSTAFLFIISRTQEADHVAAGELTCKYSIFIDISRVQYLTFTLISLRSTAPPNDSDALKPSSIPRCLSQTKENKC